MTVFLTPDRLPFYGGTYFPPEPRYGRPGFPDLLHGIEDAWRTRREEVDDDEAVEQLVRTGTTCGIELMMGGN